MARRKKRKGSSRLKGFFIFAVLFIVLANGPWLWKLVYPFNYGDVIAAEANKNDIDPLLVAAIIKAESGFNPQATSPKGAIGLMQIMPETGQWIAEQQGLRDFDKQLLYDPEFNVRFGCWYVRQLLNEFDSNQVMALAAYNGGRGNVATWLKEGLIRSEATDSEGIPFPETKKYVTKVLTNYKVYQKLYNSDELSQNL